MTAADRSLRGYASRSTDHAYFAASIGGLILVWYGFVQFFSVPEFLLPKPYTVLRQLVNNAPLLWQHLTVTFAETVLGFLLAFVVSVPVAVAVVWSRSIEKTLMPLIVFVQLVPKVAIAPLFIVWFGFGYAPKVLISFSIAYFPIVIKLVAGMRDVPLEVIDLARSMSATTLQQFARIRIPNSLPYLFDGLKLAILLALTGAITAEFMGSTEGLAYLILDATVRLNTPLLFAVVVVLLVMGRVLYSVVERIERAVVSWHVVFREKDKPQFTV